MKKYGYLVPMLVFVHVLTWTSGCPSRTAQDAVTIVANDTREIAFTEHQLILGYCVPRYEAAKGALDVENVDKVCLPAKAAYLATKSAWEALLIVLQSAKTGEATDAQVRVAAEKLATSLVQLKQVVRTLQ